jgi:hypothetical protein
MGFCDHCQGQRFDRSRVLRTLRQLHRDLRAANCDATVEITIVQAIEAIRGLDVPHLEIEELQDDVVIH